MSRAHLSPKLRRILLAIASIATVFRLVRAFWFASFIDFNIHRQIAAAVVHGELPFARTRSDAVSMPAMGVLYAPFLLMQEHTARVLFFLISIAVSVGIAVLVFGKSRTLDARPLPADSAWIAALLLLNSSPALEGLRNGQSSLMIALLLWTALLVRTRWAGPMLAIAMVLKSTFGLFGLQLLLPGRRLWTCVFAVAVFIAIACLPALFGEDLRAAYQSYSDRIALSIAPGGINDPASNGCEIVSTMFFQYQPLNLLIRALLGLAAVALLLRDFRRRHAADAFTLLFVGAASMCIVYHRQHDEVAMLPALGLVAIALWQRARKPEALIATLLIGFYLLPASPVFNLADRLGARHTWGLITSPFGSQGLTHVLPVDAGVALAVAIFAAFLCCREAPLLLTVEPA